MALGGTETFRPLALQTNWSYDAILGKGRRERFRVLPGVFHHPLPKAASHIDRPHGFQKCGREKIPNRKQPVTY